jgi:hypothetical protein
MKGCRRPGCQPIAVFTSRRRAGGVGEAEKGTNCPPTPVLIQSFFLGDRIGAGSNHSILAVRRESRRKIGFALYSGDISEEADLDGGVCDGVPHAPNDRAKTANSKAKKRRMNTSPVSICERTESDRLDRSYTWQLKRAARPFLAAAGSRRVVHRSPLSALGRTCSRCISRKCGEHCRHAGLSALGHRPSADRPA